MVLSQEGDVYTFGWNKHGQLGIDLEKEDDGDYDPSLPNPINFQENIVSIRSGGSYSCAIGGSGVLYISGKIGTGLFSEFQDISLVMPNTIRLDDWEKSINAEIENHYGQDLTIVPPKNGIIKLCTPVRHITAGWWTLFIFTSR